MASGRQAFVGLWQGIDSFDGSTQYLSVTCKSRKSCDVRLNDTSFGLSCPGGSQTGFGRGEGSIKRNVLSVALKLRCADGTGHPAQDNLFILDRRNGTLTNENNDFDGDLTSFEEPKPVFNVFHKISR
jgi:hypothetical protein